MPQLSVDFNRAVSVIMKKLNVLTQDIVIDHAVALMAELHVRTPIAAPGTSKHPGLLNSSWRTAINTHSSEPEGGQRWEFESETKSKLSAWKRNDTVFVYNNQPYGRRIEHGWGKKNPPSGFVRPALLTYTKRLKIK